MNVGAYLRALDRVSATVACLTNHGDMSDYRKIAAQAPKSLKVIGGVEISSGEGDFLIFSGDYDFLDSLEAFQDLPARELRPAGTAVVWAHPFAGTPGGSGVSEEFIGSVARKVDGIEVYNGNWPDDRASMLAHEIAAVYGLAELGGSDAHRRQALFRCWTEVIDVECAADLVEAIKARATTAAAGAGTGAGRRPNGPPRFW